MLHNIIWNQIWLFNDHDNRTSVSWARRGEITKIWHDKTSTSFYDTPLNDERVEVRSSKPQKTHNSPVYFAKNIFVRLSTIIIASYWSFFKLMRRWWELWVQKGNERRRKNEHLRFLSVWRILLHIRELRECIKVVLSRFYCSKINFLCLSFVNMNVHIFFV